MKGDESFLEKEMKFARKWLYSKNIMVPTETRNPVTVSLESFFDDCKTGKTPKANYEVGLADSTSVILANRAMDEERRVLFSEMEHPAAPATSPLRKKRQQTPNSRHLPIRKGASAFNSRRPFCLALFYGRDRDVVSLHVARYRYVCQSLPVLELACWRTFRWGRRSCTTDRSTSTRTTKYLTSPCNPCTSLAPWSIARSRPCIDGPIALSG